MNTTDLLDFFRNLSFEEKSIAALVAFLSLGAVIAFIRLSRPAKEPLPYTEDDDKVEHYGPEGGIVFL